MISTQCLSCPSRCPPGEALLGPHPGRQLNRPARARWQHLAPSGCQPIPMQPTTSPQAFLPTAVLDQQIRNLGARLRTIRHEKSLNGKIQSGKTHCVQRGVLNLPAIPSQPFSAQYTNVRLPGCHVAAPHSSRSAAESMAVRAAGEGIAAPEGPRTAAVGDMVTVHFRCKTQNGDLLESSEGKEGLTFEVGAGDIMGNPLFREFDLAVRGLCIGEMRVVQSKASDRNEDFVFDVPREHEEIVRLQKEAEAENEGPLRPGSVVVLANGEPAIIVAMSDEMVTIDANHPLAGTTLIFEVEVAAIERS